jgi:hypothetical protein
MEVTKKQNSNPKDFSIPGLAYGFLSQKPCVTYYEIQDLRKIHIAS